MSVTVMWQPQGGKILSVASASHTVSVLERAFGFPCVLSFEHVNKLEGIHASEPDNPAWQELLEAISVHETIQVWIA